MRNTFTLLKILLVVSLFQFSALVTEAQENSDNTVLTNEGVVELVKAGLSEGIILAKIKNSRCNFDSSSATLVKLKESGVSESIILAMIEAKPKVEEIKESSNTENQKTAEVKDAVGRRKVFLISVDEESRILIVKKLSEKGFSFVENRDSAEIILELTYADANTQQKTGIFRSGSETEYKSKIGKLVGRIKQGSDEVLFYAYEYPLSRNANTAAIFGLSPAPLSLKDQVKLYLVDNFVKQMKKAGDKIK